MRASEQERNAIDDSICRDSAEQLLVIKPREEFSLNQNFIVNFRARFPLREDGKGFHKLRNGAIRANFGNSEARLILPCSDDPENNSAIFDIKLLTRYCFRNACQREWNDNKDGVIGFVFDRHAISISSLCSELDTRKSWWLYLHKRE